MSKITKHKVNAVYQFIAAQCDLYVDKNDIKKLLEDANSQLSESGLKEKQIGPISVWYYTNSGETSAFIHQMTSM